MAMMNKEETMQFETGVYTYKNDDNENGRLIEIHKTTQKCIWYSIYNYYDGDYTKMEMDLLVDNKLTRNKMVIKLYNKSYFVNYVKMI